MILELIIRFALKVFVKLIFTKNEKGRYKLSERWTTTSSAKLFHTLNISFFKISVSLKLCTARDLYRLVSVH